MKSRRTRLVACTAALGLVIAACGGDDDTDDTTGTDDTVADTDGPTDTSDGADDTSPSTVATTDGVPDGPQITIGAQGFGESEILAQVYGQALAHAGYPVDYQGLGGGRDLVYTAFASGDINFTAEYAASALEFLNDFAGEASGDVAATVDALVPHLTELGLQALAPSPAVDSNAFVITAETADELGLSAVSDLTDDLTLGGPADCTENASCIPGLIATYGIDLSANFVPLDFGGPLTVAALDGDEIDVAILFSTDGVIADRGWVVLDDDEGLINADNITPVTTDLVVAAYGDDLTGLVDSVSAAMSTDELTELNRRYGIDKADADAIAAEWLENEGLLG